MTVIEVFLLLAIILSTVSIPVAVIAFLSTHKISARMDAMERAPILRQYVERFVPIDDSEKARAIVENKMKEFEREFDQSIGLMSTEVNSRDKRKIRNENNILRAEELV